MQTNYWNIPKSFMQVEDPKAVINPQSLSICLARNGGWITFGAPNTRLYVSDAQTHVLDGKGYNWKHHFYVNLSGIEVGGKAIPFNFEEDAKYGNQFFLDTGTTLIYFQDQLFKLFVSSFNSFCKSSKNSCGSASQY